MSIHFRIGIIFCYIFLSTINRRNLLHIERFIRGVIVKTIDNLRSLQSNNFIRYRRGLEDTGFYTSFYPQVITLVDAVMPYLK